MRASVDELIAEHEVIAFISQTCPFCQQAVAALTDAGYPPFIVEAETFSDIRRKRAGMPGCFCFPRCSKNLDELSGSEF
ncbi:unnamed protein product [Cladocopium goreaui]|uniref:Protein disulfide-isomerase A3 n=1 Tax=Cladocopium goreaui TaxID=2562237 RepID=A0A9P1M3A6_9DINO|nr:unnamed protein product [Cladocopium goreaui]